MGEEENDGKKDGEDELTAIVLDSQENSVHGSQENSTDDGFCSGTACRGSILGGLLFVCLFFLIRSRSRNKVDMEEITQGLELQETGNDDNDDFDCYEDTPTRAGGSESFADEH